MARKAIVTLLLALKASAAILAVAAAASAVEGDAQQQQQPPSSDGSSPWILHLTRDTDPDDFAAQLCSGSNLLQQQHGYSCTATFRTLIWGLAGRFSRAAIRAVSARYKGILERADRDRGISVGDELLSADVVRALRRARARALAELEQRAQEQGSDGGSYAHEEERKQQQRHSRSGVSGGGAREDGCAGGEFGGRGHGGFHAVFGQHGQHGQQDGGWLLHGGGAGPRRRVLPEQLDPANWGLDRIDQEALPLDRSFYYDADGSGVTVYVLDSGVRSSHVEFRRPTPANLAAAAAAAAASTARVSIVSRSTTNTSTIATTSPIGSNSSTAGDTIAGGSKVTGKSNSSNLTGGPGAPAGAAASEEPGSGAVSGSGGDGSSGGGAASDSGGSGDGGSRVVQGFSAVGNPDTEDCYGHGTHVAALAGGLSYGVAKNITIVPVQVLDCYGNADEQTLIKGLEWVARNLRYPAIVHMSLEGYYSTAINAAVDELVNTYGVVVVAAAGNHNRDACSVSPASAASAVSVAAMDRDNTRWANSNWGACVDLFAPGVSLLSAVPWSDTSTTTKTGTSMAAPLVSGVAAAYLSAHPGASPADVAQRLSRSAVAGAVADDRQGLASLTPLGPGQAGPWGPLDISSTPNRLLQSRLQLQAQLRPSIVTVMEIQVADAATIAKLAAAAYPTIDAVAAAAAAGAFSQSPNASSARGAGFASSWEGGGDREGGVGGGSGVYGGVDLGPGGSGDSGGGEPVAVGEPVVNTPASSSADTGATRDNSGGAGGRGDGVEVEVLLLQQPTAQVTITGAVPTSWGGAPVAQLQPPALAFGPDSFSQPQLLRLHPLGSAGVGPYFVQLTMRSNDPRFDFAVYSFRVEDQRPRVGESAAYPRLIRSLPFTDSGSTRLFRHDHTTSPGNPLDTSPDVVYALLPPGPGPASVTAATCGSSYDTVLLVGVGSMEQQDTLVNDDDRVTCAPTSGNSRLDADLPPGVLSYIVVSGYNGDAGDYVLSVWCRSGCGGEAGWNGSGSTSGSTGGGSGAAV